VVTRWLRLAFDVCSVLEGAEVCSKWLRYVRDEPKVAEVRQKHVLGVFEVSEVCQRLVRYVQGGYEVAEFNLG
jgi:hypothetical protein